MSVVPPVWFPIVAASGGRAFGPLPTLGEFAVMSALAVVAMWAVLVVMRWLMNLSLKERPDTLLGVMVADFRFFVRAMGKLW